MRKLSILGLAFLTLSAVAWHKMGDFQMSSLAKDQTETAPLAKVESPVVPAPAFNSSCLGESIPYFKDFEADTLNNPAQCWTELIVNPWGIASYTQVRNDFPFGGQKQLSLFNDFADTILAVSPLLNDLTMGNKQIRFVCSSTTGLACVQGSLN